MPFWTVSRLKFFLVLNRVADPTDPLGPGEFTSDDGKIYVYSMDDLVGGGNFARVFKVLFSTSFPC